MDEIRKDERIFKSEIVVNKPQEVVFDTITTLRTWEMCYPATIDVGGVTERPLRKGDLMLEKFMWGGFLYAVFEYEIVEYDPPRRFAFWGTQPFTSTFVDFFFGSFIDKISAGIEYDVSPAEGGGALWKRTSFYYHRGGLLTKLFFKTFMFIVSRSLRQSAHLYMKWAKRLMEEGGWEPPDEADG